MSKTLHDRYVEALIKRGRLADRGRRQQMICESCGEEYDEPTVTVYRPDCWGDCYTMSAMGMAGHPTEEWCLTCAIERIGDWQNSPVVVQ